MVVTTGGGYYPVYLAVCLGVLTLIALYWHKPAARPRQLRRAVLIALLAAGLTAVVWLPLTDGLRFTSRDAPPDYPQNTAQPIAYALFNYVVSDEGWFGANVLNKGIGYGWFYIGALPLLALTLTPWLYGRFPARRRSVIALFGLLVVLLLWHANPYTPVRYLYQWFPTLYIFRFPNRLLVVAAAPLIILAAINAQTLLVWARRWWRGLDVGISTKGAAQLQRSISMVRVLNLLVLFIIAMALGDVYEVNQAFGMAPHPRNQNARETLTWLKEQDSSLYYVNIGGTQIYWDWMAAAYELELPVINFRYNRRVSTMDQQYTTGAPFNAQPKYILAGSNQPPPSGAQLINEFQGVNVWYQPDVLPFAFSTVTPEGPVTRAAVTEQPVRWDGPNRVVVTAESGESGEHLMVLVSDYPGWRLWVDGERATVQSVNGYLGARMEEGEHTYVFAFHPLKYDLGLAVTVLSLLLCIWWVGFADYSRASEKDEQSAGEDLSGREVDNQ